MNRLQKKELRNAIATHDKGIAPCGSHYWIGNNNQIMINLVEHGLLAYKNKDDAVNDMFVNGHKELARLIHKDILNVHEQLEYYLIEQCYSQHELENMTTEQMQTEVKKLVRRKQMPPVRLIHKLEYKNNLR